MKKNDLRALRSLYATQGMITTMRKTQCNNFARAQCLGGIVKIAFFYRSWLKDGIRTPAIETFINREGEEWISRILDKEGNEVRWTESMLYNLDFERDGWYYGGLNKTWVTNDTFRTARSFSKNCERKDCLYSIAKWQEGIRKARTLEKEKKETKPWDDEMSLVPEVPKGLVSWMHRECCNQFYLVYKYKRNPKEAYCTRCGQTVRVEGLKNDVMKICPKCHVKATCKSEGRRMHTQRTGVYTARVLQKVKGGIVERHFNREEQYWKDDVRKPYVNFWESDRILILDGQQPKKYHWQLYKNKYERWCPGNNDRWGYASLYYGKGKIYPPTTRGAMESEVMTKSSYGLWEVPPVDLFDYVMMERGCPPLEMLARIGMFSMAEGLIKARYDRELLKEDETELAKILKIDAMRLKRLKAMDCAGITELKWMQLEKLSDTIWPDQMINDFGMANIKPRDLQFLPHKCMTVVQIWNYMKKQEKLSGTGMGTLLGTWDDYLSMAGSMKMDVHNSMIFKPKNLKDAHDELVIIKNTEGMEKEAKKLEKKFPKVNAQLAKLKKFEYRNGKFQIIAPQKVLDIVREGRILQHCVHTCDYYFSRITSDESYLFFLRKSDRPDMPWYTLEVEPSGNIRQKRTTGDRQNKDFEEAIEFLKKWQKHFRRQLTKKEKALGVKADEMRKKNYKKLREEAKRVWHGPLAGQLLADVLEADFMEAM